MNCIGYIFDERPLPVSVRGFDFLTGENGIIEIGYTCPPFGSKIVRECGGNAFAFAPDGFEWVLLSDEPVWVPTGLYMYHPSIEGDRNFRMKPTEDEF